MRPLRLPTAFTAALGAHSAVALVLVAVPRAHATAAIARPLPQELFIETEALAPPTPASVREAAPSGPTRPSVRPLDARAARAPINATLADVPPQSDPVPPPPEGDGRSPAPSASIDLGIGGYWKSVAMSGPLVEEPPPVSSAEPPPRTSLDRIMKDELEARDHELGLGSGGPLVSAAHEAASLAIAPDTGTAMFDIVADAEGRVMSATLVSVGGDGPGWSDVARELVSLMSSKRLHVPHGAHGYRARLQITAEQALPAGSKTSTSLGAVPDDIPGGEKACVGEGIHRKCKKGSPVGLTGTWADLSNIGARAVRIVRAQILSEGAL